MTQAVAPPPGGFIEVFHAIAQAEGHRPFARCDGALLRFHDLDEASGTVARALRARGMVAGDRVASMVPNGRDALAIILGLARAGMVWVPLNPQLVGDGLRYILGHARPRLVLAAEEEGDKLREAGAEAITPAALAAGPLAPRGTEAIPAPEDDVALCYTSGTTGPPKGVRVSHRMLRLAGEGVILVADARDGDVMFMWEPLYHIGGAQMVVAPLLRRLALHLAPRFSASRFWDEVTEAGATHIHYLGGILQILLKQPPSPRERTHGVRIAWGGGAPADIWDAVRDRFGLPLRECYGMTESSSFTTYNARGVTGAVGRPMPWFEVALLDGEGHPVRPAERGEIVVRARDPLALTQGYLDNPEATARALRAGALHTGDWGSFDAEENLFFHGRVTDSARVRGENVGAWEVEGVAARHPAIADCAMIGVSASLGEQEIKLFVELRPGARLTPEALSAWLAPRLARYQLPRYIAIVTGFERTPSQRIMKHRLSRALGDGWDRLAHP